MCRVELDPTYSSEAIPAEPGLDRVTPLPSPSADLEQGRGIELRCLITQHHCITATCPLTSFYDKRV